MSNRFSSMRRGLWTWQATGAICGLMFSLLAVIFGSIITASTWVLGAASHPSLHRLGSVLLLLTIPSLIFGGLCFDQMEAQGRRKRRTTRGHSKLTTVSGDNGAKLATMGVALLLLLFGVCIRRAGAQQTIFNVPSTDVLDRGKVYGELDASFKPNNSEAVNRFSSFVPRVVFGAGGRVEVGLNVTGNVQPGADATTLVPAIKWKLYQGKQNGVSIVVGDHLFLPVRNRAYTAGNYVYAEVSKTFKAGTRLTAGGYDFTKSVVASRNRAGGQFGFEQPVNKKVTLAADYFTGKHAAGYFTPGVVFKLSTKVTGYAGYSIGNQNPSHGNNFFLLEVGYNFN